MSSASRSGRRIGKSASTTESLTARIVVTCPIAASTSGSTFRSSTATRAAVSVDDVHELAPPLPGHVDEHGAAKPDCEVRAYESHRARQRDYDSIAGNDACSPQPGGQYRPPHRTARRRSATSRARPPRSSPLDAAEATATRAGRRRSPECGQELPRVALERVERRARGGVGRRRVERDRVLVDHPEREVLDPDVHELAQRRGARRPACRGRSTCRSRA